MKPSFKMHSTVYNDKMDTQIVSKYLIDVRFVKKQDGLSIQKEGHKEITIPYKQFKDFCMGALEAYCQFSKPFCNVDVDIDISLESRTEEF